MSEFKTGQRVRVEYIYEGEVMSNGPHTLNIQVEGGHVRMLNMNQPDVKVTLLDPADWPPQAGDIWEKDGEEYYTRDRHTSPGIIVEPFSISARGPSQYRDDYGTLDAFKALNPVLVRRRGQ